MMAVIEKFLSKHLNGNSEEFGDDIKNSNITVPIGVNLIRDLKN